MADLDEARKRTTAKIQVLSCRCIVRTYDGKVVVVNAACKHHRVQPEEPDDLCTCGHERHVHVLAANSVYATCTDPECVLDEHRPYRCGRFFAASQPDAERSDG